jgi:hypothetical protein
VTRIVIDPADLRRGARTLEDTAIAYRQSALRLRGLPLPEMPAGVSAAVTSAITRASVTLDMQVLPLALEADELRRRAFWTEISGEAGGWPDGPGFVWENKFWIKQGLALFAPTGVLPTVIATKNGYRIVNKGDYVTVRGRHPFGSDLWSRYVASGRVPGTRYRVDNPKVAKAFRLSPALRAKGFEMLPFDNRFLKAAGKGSGPLGLGLTFGEDIHDFTRGSQSSKGLASTDFAATVAVDAGLAGGTAVVATGAGVGAAAASGALAGSVVPGVGTVVGFVVAGGVAYALTTDSGRAVRGAMISGTKTAMDYAKKNPTVLAPIPGATGAVAIYNHRDDIIDAAGEGVSKLNDARKWVGGLF